MGMFQRIRRYGMHGPGKYTGKDPSPFRVYDNPIREFIKRAPITTAAFLASTVPISLSLYEYIKEGSLYDTLATCSLSLAGASLIGWLEGTIKYNKVSRKRRRESLEHDLEKFGFHDLIMRECEQDNRIFKLVEDISKEKGNVEDFYRSFEHYKKRECDERKSTR